MTRCLTLEPGAHDLVIHAMALHWANDPVGQLVQCRRALRPDGLFLGVLFGGQTLHELRACLAEAEVAVTGGLVAPRSADGRDPRSWRRCCNAQVLPCRSPTLVSTTVTYRDCLPL